MTERELEYYREYNRRSRLERGMKPSPHLYGTPVKVDAEYLRSLITRRGMTVREASLSAGLCETALFHVLRRGTCKEPTLDKLACSLGVNMYDLEVVE